MRKRLDSVYRHEVWVDYGSGWEIRYVYSHRFRPEAIAHARVVATDEDAIGVRVVSAKTTLHVDVVVKGEGSSGE